MFRWFIHLIGLSQYGIFVQYQDNPIVNSKVIANFVPNNGNSNFLQSSMKKMQNQ